MPSGTGHKAYIARLKLDDQEKGKKTFVEFDFEDENMELASV